MRFQLSGIWFRYADLLTTGRPFKVLAMFVLGLWVGRSGMLRDPEPWVPLLRRVRLVGLAVGLPAALVQALMEVQPGPPGLAVEAAGVGGVRAGRRAAGRWPTPRTWRCSGAGRCGATASRWAIPAGRMALDQLPDADRHRHRALLRHRPGPDGRGRSGDLADHCRRGRGASGCRQLVVARPVPVRPDGMAVAAGHLWPFFTGFKFRRVPPITVMPRAAAEGVHGNRPAAAPPPHRAPPTVVQLSDAVFARQRGVMPGRARPGRGRAAPVVGRGGSSTCRGRQPAVRNDPIAAAAAQANMPAERAFALLFE